MTHEGYEIISASFKKALDACPSDDSLTAYAMRDALCLAAEIFCDKATEGNPKFDKTLFLQSCGLEE